LATVHSSQRWSST